MRTKINKGVWALMLTPFTEDDRIDFDAIEGMMNYYYEHGCTGVFAICGSNEMQWLNRQEKLDIAKAAADACKGRMEVVASGHTARNLDEQLEEIEAMMNIEGISEYVLVSNALDPDHEGTEVFLRNFHKILDTFPEVEFGLYEAPIPYKRLVTEEELYEISHTGRVGFMKDTCCDYEMIRRRLKAVEGTPFSLFNANAASFKDSWAHGCAGFNGIGNNFHPELFKWYMEHAESDPEQADLLFHMLTVFALIELRAYPISAKYHMNLMGVPMSLHTRSRSASLFDKNAKQEVDSMYAIEQYLHQKLSIQ